MTVVLLIVALVLFIGLVVVHEWGHFIAARRGGVEVEEFGIGFPPKIWGRKIKTKKSKFLFTINALPLGGFVRLKGENVEDKRSGSFGGAPLGTKVKIMLAGVAMNLLVAFLLLSFLAAIGVPKIVPNQFEVTSDKTVTQQVQNADVVIIGNVTEGSPAETAGVKRGDRIISINGQMITTPDQIGKLTEANAGEEIRLTVQRNGEQVRLRPTLNPQNDEAVYLGVESKSAQSGIEVQRYTWSAPVVAAGLIKQFSELTFKGLGTAISSLFKGDTQKAGEQVTGPVGIFYILRENANLGFVFILMIMAVISLTLALINALPIPALDGGRLFVTLLFEALNKPLTKRAEEAIHGTGFLLLMALFVLITIVDVNRFF